MVFTNDFTHLAVYDDSGKTLWARSTRVWILRNKELVSLRMDFVASSNACV